jgi:rRNA maturation RNase YbeY
LAILFHEDLTRSGLKDKRNIKSWIISVIEKENLKLGNINIILLGDEELRKINIEFLSHDYYTDIITFDYSEGLTLSGDIYISMERVKDNAERFNVTGDNELLRVIIHGILHLIGYKDSSESEKKKMRFMEDNCLRDYYSKE